MTGGTCDRNDPQCLSPILREPWETDFGAIVPRCTGSLSAISSVLIITIILRSQSGLSTIYHRIMFGMSFGDICSSIAIALTSLPMPRQMPNEEEFGYHWAGTRLGNTGTCNAQGFFATFGMMVTFSYNSTLCIYYGCSFALAMKEKDIMRYVEPFLHLLPFGLGILAGIYPLLHDMYNPAVSTYAWCASVTYPEECLYRGNVDCYRGNEEAMATLRTGFFVLVVMGFCVISITMVMVVIKSIYINNILNEVHKKIYQRENDTPTWQQFVKLRHTIVKRQNNVKAVIIQAMSYVLSFVITLSLPLLANMGIFSYPIFGDEDEWQNRFWVDKAILVLLPLQGFFNFFIFVSLKMYAYWQTDKKTISFMDALAKVLFKRYQEPCYISRISIVHHDQNCAPPNNASNIGDAEIRRDKCQYAEPKNKDFSLCLSDESDQSPFEYRIKLFATSADNARDISLDDDVIHGSSPVSIEEVGNDEEDLSYISDDYGSDVRISFSVKSESTINAEEQRKNQMQVMINSSA